MDGKLTEPRSLKLDPYKQQINVWLEEAPYSAARILEKLQNQGFWGKYMPYMRKSGQKYTSHWMTSPLKHLEASCSTCHDQGTAWLQERVKTVQDHTFQVLHTAGLNVARAHEAIKNAAEAPGADQAELGKARELVRKAQWYWDYIAAENSMGFHNPSLALNTAAQASEMARQAIDAANRAAGMKVF